MGEKKLFNRLFEENLFNNRKLVNLNDKITDLENKFKKKYGDEIFLDYCKISDLIVEEFIECTNFSFELGMQLEKI